MLLHPLQDLDLVLQAIVHASSLQHLGSREEPVRTDPVVEGDHHHGHIGRFDQSCSIVVGAGVGIEAASLNPNENGQPRSSFHRAGSVYIEEETILGRACGSGILAGGNTPGTMLCPGY